jgi:hypothetical protein
MTKGKVTPLTHLMNREAFLKASHLRTQEVSIPDVGTVTVRELSTAQRKEYVEYLELDKDNQPKFSVEKQVDFNKFIISLGLIDETGSRMFASYKDVPELRQDVADAIAKAIMQLSGIIPQDAKLPLAETPKPTSDTPSQ